MTKLERETIILFNEAESEATIETCNEALKNRLREISAKNPQCRFERKDEYSERYIIPKKWLKVRPPLEISDERRAKMAATARERFGRGKKNG